MKAPKQPSKRSTQIKSVATGGEPPTLTPAEITVLAAYRAMDDETREDTIEIVEILARRNPRAPRLRLVSERST
jgi:hypothetical protein